LHSKQEARRQLRLSSSSIEQSRSSMSEELFAHQLISLKC